MNTITTDEMLPGITLSPAEVEFWNHQAHQLLNASVTANGNWRRNAEAKEVDRLIGADTRKRCLNNSHASEMFSRMDEVLIRLCCALYEQRQDLRDQSEIEAHAAIAG